MTKRILTVLLLTCSVVVGPAALARRSRARPKPPAFETAELRERALPSAQPSRETPPAPTPVDDSAVAAVVRDNRAAIKLCYQRVLKREPGLKVTKLVATLKIERSGRVAGVTFANSAHEADMGPCLTQAIASWAFPASTTDYAFTLPIVLATD